MKSNKGKMIHHIQGNPITLTGDFSTEAMKIRRQWGLHTQRKKKNVN